MYGIGGVQPFPGKRKFIGDFYVSALVKVRNLGAPVDLAGRYFDEGADEVTFLNITGFRDFPLGDLPMLEVSSTLPCVQCMLVENDGCGGDASAVIPCVPSVPPVQGLGLLESG